MIDRFPGGVYQPGFDMAARTRSVGQYECGTGMASLATDNCMCTVEFEAGTEMIELRLRLCNIHGYQNGTQGYRQTPYPGHDLQPGRLSTTGIYRSPLHIPQ